MKKNVLLAIVLLLISHISFSQKLLLPLSRGGEFDGGTVIEVNLDDGQYVATPFDGKIETTELGFGQSDVVPTSTSGIFYESSNNSLYITSKYGAREPGANNGGGAIFRYDILSKKTYLIRKYSDEDILGYNLHSKMVKMNNLLYGVCANGGKYGYGCIFSIDPSDDSYQVVYDLNGTTDGGKPSCGLFVDGNKLYGGGKYGNGAEGLVIFCYDIATKSYKTLVNENAAVGHDISGLYLRNGKLYFSYGSSIYVMGDPLNSNNYTSHFIGLGANTAIGTKAYDFTYRNGDGRWYVVFEKGGANDHGSIGRMIYSQSGVTNIHSFQGGTLGRDPNVKLTDGLNGDMYGIAYGNSGTEETVLFKINDIGVYSVLHYFNNYDDGSDTKVAPVLVGSKLFGISEYQGKYGCGTVWSYDLGSGDFHVEAYLGFPEGKSPMEGLTLVPGSNQYKLVTFQGGEYRKGTIQTYDLNTHAFTKNVDFNDVDFTYCTHKPIIYNNKEYYLVAANGQRSAYNAFYLLVEFNSDGTFKTVIPIAPSSDILERINGIVGGNIIQENNMIYGGSHRLLWQIDLDSNTYSTLYQFDVNVDGELVNYLQKKGDSLITITNSKGVNGKGTLFLYNINDQSHSVIYDVDASVDNHHTSFSVYMDKLIMYKQEIGQLTSIYTLPIEANASMTKIAEIDSTSNGYDLGSLLQIYNGKLYGATNKGGLNDKGGIFTMDLQTNTISQLINFTRETGHHPYNGEFVFVDKATNVTELSNEKEFSLYPNPVTDYLRIYDNDYTQIKIYDLKGKLLITSEKKDSYDLALLSSGVYVIQVMDRGQIKAIHKFVVTK